jgi:transposase InsO family protein
MYAKLQPEGMGKDHFEEFCKIYGFSVVRRINPCRTTDSNGVVCFDNLLEGLVFSYINEVWSSDITNYEVASCFYYLTLIMDCFSIRILAIQSVHG